MAFDFSILHFPSIDIFIFDARSVKTDFRRTVSLVFFLFCLVAEKTEEKVDSSAADQIFLPSPGFSASEKISEDLSMPPYSLSSNDSVKAIEELVKSSKETHQECDQEEGEEDDRRNHTRKTEDLREGRTEELNAEDDLIEGEDTAKMAEACGGRNREDGEVEEEEEDKEEEEDDDSSQTSSLVELNLLIVFLSLFSASAEESLDSEERSVVRRPKNNEEKASASRLQQPRVRKMDELKVVSRQTPPMRFQTTIKDSRHGRRF